MHIGTNCAPLLADLFLYSYEADFPQEFLKKNEKKLARFFNQTFHYIDNALSLNYSRFGDFVDRIYPTEHLYVATFQQHLHMEYISLS